MATKAKRTKRPRQGHLPGLGPIKAIEDAAANYIDVMLDRCRLSKEEHELKDALIDVMHKNGLKRYEMTDGRVIMVTAKSNVKCKKKKKDKAETPPSTNGTAE